MRADGSGRGPERSDRSQPPMAAVEASKEIWSIGIYTGPTPLRLGEGSIPGSTLRPANPVLTAASITDVTAEFVADPFLDRDDDRWHMWFEVMDARTGKGKIGIASSLDGCQWKYAGVVLDEPFHLSYPYVFRWRNNVYLVPESHEAFAIRLYRATAYPYHWRFVQTLLEGRFVDASLFRYARRWWMYACDADPAAHDTLRLYHADELVGPWSAHPANPLIRGDPHSARPAGRVVRFGPTTIRYAQDDGPGYGLHVRAFSLRELSPKDYREEEVPTSPILSGSGRGWNRTGMHHVDPHRVGAHGWLASVDGHFTV